MTFDEFEVLVAQHGTDPKAWPNPAVAKHEDVREWLSAEQAFEATLIGETDAALSANFSDRVVAALPQKSTPARLWWAGAPIAACLIAAAFFSLDDPAIGSDPTIETEEWATLADDTGFDDLYEWTMEDS